MNNINKLSTVEVTWWDAQDTTEVDLAEATKRVAGEYLAKRVTYGKLLKEEDTAILIIRDYCEDDRKCEITAIPTPWVVNIKKVE